jgi:hypothetical protein
MGVGWWYLFMVCPGTATPYNLRYREWVMDPNPRYTPGAAPHPLFQLKRTVSAAAPGVGFGRRLFYFKRTGRKIPAFRPALVRATQAGGLRVTASTLSQGYRQTARPFHL